MHHLNPFWFGAGGGGATDPYFANVVGLFHFDETPGSTTYNDFSSLNNDMVNVGQTQTSSAQSVFGGVSLLVGTPYPNSCNNTPSGTNYAFGTGDFTVELRFRCAAVALKNICDMRTGTPGNRLDIYTLANGSLIYHVNSVDRITTSAGTIVANTWYAIAYDRVGTTGRLYLDGAVAGSWTDNINYDTGVSIALTLPSGNTAAYENSHFDEFRVTKGTARYQGAYTPATSAFPDS